MAVVLCFGDSLTFGYDPATGGRYDPADRWPEVMAADLGHTVISEALPGRTTVFDSPYAPVRSGKQMLAPILESHAPIDVVVLMLGTNDLQGPLELSARHSASGLWTLVDIVNRSAAGPDAGKPGCLVVAPPEIADPKGFMGVFFTGREEQSRELTVHYRTICEQTGTAFLAASDVVEPSPVDGIHLSREGQRTLGHAVAQAVKELLA
ncbi:MAG: SGNH/GDSL hydrolase family protein [Candidatus Nanopelagicales bacterium]|jgi:lysophospholipase L1-like esterase|nr:SGNH/GDSL hydrolase family protein [Candidatus Nanopelagicales bacterium]